MELRRRDFRDPLEVLIARESETCAGCQNLAAQRYMGVTKFICTKAVQKSALAVTEMNRCKLYWSET